MNLLVVIPARGGSKGIPRKNLRPLGGKPLIYYSIKESLKLHIKGVSIDVVVTTDDEEIELFAGRFGAKVIKREHTLANDCSTLDPVIKHAMDESENKFNKSYDYIVTVQPTSPLVHCSDLENAFNTITSQQCDTVISVVDDRHLCWTVKDNISVPLYRERVNRQNLPVNYKETGAVLICSAIQLKTEGSRVGSNVSIFQMPFERSFDIDTYADLSVCEAMLARKKVVFTVVGYAEVGLGHAFRTLMLAHELVQYDLVFVIEKGSDLAINYIKEHNYTVVLAENGKLLDKVIEVEPELVINDILDTDYNFVLNLKQHGCKVVNFEDLGSGAQHADLVVNALYPHQNAEGKVLVGPQYFCLRDEFLYLGDVEKRSKTSLLVTFGGVDEGNITLSVVKEVSNYCVNNDIFLDVVVGPGYDDFDALSTFMENTAGLDFNLVKQTNKISEHMIKADVAITSGGRTVLELNALKVPTVVICQNQRELSHTFASNENGVLNLGHREKLKPGEVLHNLSNLIENHCLREKMISKMERLDLSKGKERVTSMIKALLN